MPIKAPHPSHYMAGQTHFQLSHVVVCQKKGEKMENSIQKKANDESGAELAPQIISCTNPPMTWMLLMDWFPTQEGCQ